MTRRSERVHWREPVGWEKYAQLLEYLADFAAETPTAEVLRAVGLTADQRGGIGALHAASAIGRCFATSAGRRTLVWSPGRRPEGLPTPNLARAREYKRVLVLLSRHPRDAVPTARIQELVGDRSRQEVMGAMKLFVAAGLIVHLLVARRTAPGLLTCWGWSGADLQPADRVYRPGRPPPAPLSLDWVYGDGFTLLDGTLVNG